MVLKLLKNSNAIKTSSCLNHIQLQNEFLMAFFFFARQDHLNDRKLELRHV